METDMATDMETEIPAILKIHDMDTDTAALFFL